MAAASFAAPGASGTDMEGGYLTKCGEGVMKSWKRRWFAISNDTLTYSERPEVSSVLPAPLLFARCLIKKKIMQHLSPVHADQRPPRLSPLLAGHKGEGDHCAGGHPGRLPGQGLRQDKVAHPGCLALLRHCHCRPVVSSVRDLTIILPWHGGWAHTPLPWNHLA